MKLKVGQIWRLPLVPEYRLVIVRVRKKSFIYELYDDDRLMEVDSEVENSLQNWILDETWKVEELMRKYESSN